MTTAVFEVCTSKVLLRPWDMGRWWSWSWWWVVDHVIDHFYIRDDDDDDDDDEKRGTRGHETRVLYLPVCTGRRREKVTTSTAPTLTSRDSIHSCSCSYNYVTMPHGHPSKAVGGGLHRATQKKEQETKPSPCRKSPCIPSTTMRLCLPVCAPMTSSTTTTLCVQQQRDFPSSEGWGDRKTRP
jgi:hypothetical protein